MIWPALTALLNAMPMPQVLIGPGGRVAAVNSAAVPFLGEGMEGLPFVTVLRQPQIIEAMERCLATGTSQIALYFRRDGSREHLFHAHIHPLQDVSEELYGGALITLQDTSEMEALEQVRQDFIANVSHELRTPLTSILGFVETLQGSASRDLEAQRQFLTIMHAEAMRMSRLIEDLLSLSRLESTAPRQPEEVVNIAILIEAVCSAQRKQIDSQNTEIYLPKQAHACEVLGRPDELKQLFSNLIENALKYGGTRVNIEYQTIKVDPILRGPAISISIIDDGSGIEPHHIPRLTERFYRVDDERSREKGGTGLGLAIAKHIVTRHRGRLRISSAPGQGSTFCVVLPTTDRR